MKVEISKLQDWKTVLPKTSLHNVDTSLARLYIRPERLEIRLDRLEIRLGRLEIKRDRPVIRLGGLKINGQTGSRTGWTDILKNCYAEKPTRGLRTSLFRPEALEMIFARLEVKLTDWLAEKQTKF